jgi:pectin methylesterase-like acyl-CoA thioesterase
MSLDPTSSVSGINNLSYLNQENEIKPIEIKSRRNPLPTDRRYKTGTLWINQATNNVWALTSVRGGIANWEPLSATGDNAPITKYVVSQDGTAAYTTIQAALDAANADGGGQIFIRQGTYTENLTFYDQIDVWGSSEEDVVIIGTHTPPLSGYLTLFRCQFQSATDIFNSSAAGTAYIVMDYCVTKVTNGYTFYLPNWTGLVKVFKIRDPGTIVDNGVWFNNGGAPFAAYLSDIGKGTAKLFNSSAFIILHDCEVDCPFLFQTGTNIDFRFSFFNKNLFFSSGSGSIDFCSLTNATGADVINASGIGGAGLTLSNCTIITPNDPAITGSSSNPLYLNNVVFTQNTNIAPTLTNINSAIIKGANFISQFIVDPRGESGNYKTIQSAINAADSAGGGTIYIHPGSYTENLAFKSDVDLVGAIGDSLEGQVIIIGQHAIPSGFGQFTLRNILFSNSSTNSIIINTTTTSIDISFIRCTFKLILGGASLDFLANGHNGTIVIRDCEAISTNDAFLKTSGLSGNFEFWNSNLGGLGTTNSMTFSDGAIFEINNCNIGSKISVAGNLTCFFELGSSFSNTITLSGNSQGEIINCDLTPNTGAAIDYLTAQNFYLSEVNVDSTNNPAISGSGTGTLRIGSATFINNSNISASLTLETGNIVSGEFIAKTAGKGISIKEGTNARMGVATLVAGTVVVNTTAVTANSRILLTTQSIGGTAGFLVVLARTPGANFTISSSSGTDTSIVAWMIIEPA